MVRRFIKLISIIFALQCSVKDSNIELYAVPEDCPMEESYIPDYIRYYVVPEDTIKSIVYLKFDLTQSDKPFCFNFCNPDIGDCKDHLAYVEGHFFLINPGNYVFKLCELGKYDQLRTKSFLAKPNNIYYLDVNDKEGKDIFSIRETVAISKYLDKKMSLEERKKKQDSIYYDRLNKLKER